MMRGKVSLETGSLTTGSVVNGLAAYGFIALGTRSIGAEEFAPVAVLWAFWAASAAVLTFPVQHWAIRRLELGGPGALRGDLGRVVGLVVALAAVEAALAVGFGERLFGDGRLLWPLAVAGLAVGSGFMGLVRGLLAGSGRYHAAAVAIGGENVIRLGAAAVALTVDETAGALALALLAGPLIAALWPGIWRLGKERAPSGEGVGLLGAAGAGVLLSQVLLNGGPPLMAAAGGAEAEVTALFAALAVFRAPYLVALGMSVRATAPVARMIEQGRSADVRRVALIGSGAAAAISPVAAAAGGLVGPPVLGALFGAGARPDAGVAAAIAAGCVLALAALGLTVVLIAGGAASSLTVVWVLAVLASVPILVAGDTGSGGVMAVAFLVGEGAAVAAGAVAVSRLGAR